MTRTNVQKCVEGKHLPLKISQKQIVKWDADGRNVRPGPGVIIIIIVIIVIIVIILIILIICVQESNSTKLNVKKQDDNMMLMRDTMHQIDLGVIISFFKAILRKYYNNSTFLAKQLRSSLLGCKGC